MLYDIIVLSITVIFIGGIFKFILPPRGVKQLEITELHDRLREANAQFIDVRNREIYERFHIFNFENIPLRDLKKRADELDKDKKVIVICQTGQQANTAAKRLKRLGFKDIEHVKRGISSWEPMQSRE